MPKLTDSQLVILSAAAQREDHALLPLPNAIMLNKGAAALVLKSLLRQGLAVERPATPEDALWREQDGKRLTLAVSESGLAAIGVEAPAKTARTAAAKAGRSLAPRGKPTRTEAGRKRPERKAPAKAGVETKQALLISLLRRKGGATLEELTQATGWQPHSVRGAISGLVKKKLGFPVASELVANRGRIYRITGR